MVDQSYGEDSDQTYDLYLPAERTLETKVLILIYGGGWTSGDKSRMDGFKDFLRT
jgi:acetyl esterase/lipase